MHIPYKCDAIMMMCNVQVIRDVAERLCTLHEAGFVHCDLRPATILWLSRMHSWTPITYSSLAACNEWVQPDWFLRYVAPEAVRAVVEGSTMRATPSLDAWSLGAIAFELLMRAAWAPPTMLEDEVLHF